MSHEFKWERRLVVSPEGQKKELMEFLECRLPFEGDRLITGIVARIRRVEFDQEQAYQHGCHELYFPALDVELRNCLRVCVKGGFPVEPWPTPRASISVSVEDLEAFSSGDAERLSTIREQEKVKSVQKSRGDRHLTPEGEYEFEDAEDVVRDFVREVVASLREDANAIQQAIGGDVLSVTEVAEVFGVPRNTVLNWIKTGSLRAFRLGSKWMIERKDLASAVEESKARAVVQETFAAPVAGEDPGHE